MRLDRDGGSWLYHLGQGGFAKYTAEELERHKARMGEGLNKRGLLPPSVDVKGWRLIGERGQQVWIHTGDSAKERKQLRDDVDGARDREQEVYEKFHLGLPLNKTEAPVTKKARSATEAALKGARFAARIQVPGSGHFGNDYGGPHFLLPGLIFTYHCAGISFTKAQRGEMIRYLLSQQNGDGGWGIHTEAPSSVFGTSLTYVSLRFLGVEADHEDIKRARRFLRAVGGAIGTPLWGKWWLATVNLYSWDGVPALTPELWILPRWVPFHPWRFWCHCRMVKLPMTYIYGTKYQAPVTDLTLALREELYVENYDAIQWRNFQLFTNPLDAYTPLHPVVRLAMTVLGWYEKFGPIQSLRDRAQNWLLELLKVEDESTNYIDIGPVNKAMNMLSAYVAYGASSEQFHLHMQRAPDYLWQSHDGMKMQGYNGSQSWDTSFMSQAVVAALKGASSPSGVLPNEPALKEMLLRAHSYLDITQVRDNTPNGDYYYRHQSKGAWPFSTRDHGWPIADCTAEGMKGAQDIESLASWLKLPPRQHISLQRYCDAVDVMLSLRNEDDGGWPTYELKRAGEWLEVFNPTEVFARIMVDYSYVELTSACITALCKFRKLSPEAAAYRKDEVDLAISQAVRFVKKRQRADGSWYGSWAVCFTYGAWFGVWALIDGGEGESAEVERACKFLLDKQQSDGGWGETWWSCYTGEYCSMEEEGSIPECTSWAIMALCRAYPYLEKSNPEFAREVEHSCRLGASHLIDVQKPNGDWIQGSPCGIFNGTSINYGMYRLSMSVWALGIFADTFERDE